MIYEDKYLEFLSINNGGVSKKLIYNRTGFTDKEFYKVRQVAENQLIINFVKSVLLHPFFVIKH